MSARAFFRLGLAAIVLFVLGCAPAVFTPPDIGSVAIQDKYNGYFTVGVATTPSKLDAVKNIVDFHFNRLAAENDMKFGSIHPNTNTYNFTNADALANYARARGIKMTGHTLIWHNQLPSNGWPFAGLTKNTDAARTALKATMKAHIDTLVERYYDVIDNWDVVNEAIDDSGNYRVTSAWYDYYGSADYIYWAFRYTKEALEAHNSGTGSSSGKLYYNDYSLENTAKLNKIIDMVKWLRQDAGANPLPTDAGGVSIAIDGIGNQAHWGLGWPGIATMQATIDAITSPPPGLNIKFKVSELDISASNGSSGKIDFTQTLELQQAERYRQIFQLIRSPIYSGKITSVTLWGVSDEQSWLNNFPITARDDYPLLFDRTHNAKQAYYKIIDF